MAIDKTIPNRLQADADQRLVRPEVGEMLDAQNVTMAEGGGSSSGVIKNVRGTLAGTPLTASDRIADDDEVTVIGSVSDPQRGFIYWFVADNSANSGNGYAASEHAIYQYNTSDNTYRRVIKSAFLGFRPNGFVKADVVNASFQQDGVIQTALYFTDNENPPRKINVDRQISGGYVAPSSTTTFNQSYGAIKSAPNVIPTTSFETDSSINQNNFNKNIFQFSFQYVYNDGEESAISPYSAPAIPRGSFFSKMTEEGYGVYRTTDNVCVINPSIETIPPDVEKIRFLARKGNDGAFFVVEEVDVDTDLSREIYGTLTKVYDSSNRRYRFYNDAYGSVFDQNVVNKLYDNVPFLASGQSVTGNRLMYSNYEEGRPNVTPIVTMNVNYSALPSSERSNNFIAPADVSSVISIDALETDPNVKIDLLGGSSFDSLETSPPADFQTVVPAGTSVEIYFDFNLGDFTATAVSGDLISAETIIETEEQGGDFITTNTTLTKASMDFDTSGILTDQNSVAVQVYVSTDTQIQALVDDVNTALFGVELSQSYSFSDQSFTGSNGFSDDYDGDVKVYWKVDDTVATTSTLLIKPRISKIELSNLSLSSSSSTVVGISSDGNSWSNVLDTFGVNQNEITYSSIQNTTYTSNVDAKAFAKLIVPTFKSGSTHDFGIVYYDEHNRSGNVNELGSVYVQDPSYRANQTPAVPVGPASVTINFDDAFTPPSWAKRFQIVYAGRNTVGDFTQYTVGSAYRFRYKTSQSGNYNDDPNDKRLALSLHTLDNYIKEKNPTRDYSFTKGDKLRVVRRRSGAQSSFTDSYPIASDSETVIEFNVLEVKTFGADDHEVIGPITGHQGEDPHTGTFLIIEAPEITSLIEGLDGNTLKYPGYDWFEVAGVEREPGDSTTPTNNWPGTLIEIYSPKSQPEEKVYYEIGHGAAVGPRKDVAINDHGDRIEITNGDCYIRPVSCEMAYDDPEEPSLWFYQTLEIETDDINDEYPSKIWAKGRAHVPFVNAATIRRYNGITYSDAYAEDVANLSLSSFNPSLANFFSLDSVNGACNYIDTFRDGYLLAFQENRVSRVGVNKDIITTPAAGQITSLTTSVLGEPVYYLGDFGCGDNPESVLIRDGNAFFVDMSRKKLVRLTSEGLSPISENGVDSMFKTNLDSFTEEGGTRIVSGYDPEDNQYYVTLRQIDNPAYDPEVEGSEEFLYNGLTLGYNISAGAWQSRYTFYPDMYSDQNGTMYSAYYTQNEAVSDDAEVFHHHTNETDYNTFYGGYGSSIVKVVSNLNPSMTKVFNAISTEGSEAQRWVASVITDLGSNGSIDIADFQDKEGSRYASIRRDSSSNSTKHIIPIGEVASSDIGTGVVTFVNRVNTLPLMSGSTVMEVDGLGNLTNIGTPINSVLTSRTLGSVVATRQIQLDFGTSVNLTGKDLVLVTDQDQNGNPIRGHWAEITLTTNQATPFELYCVNTHIVQSHQDHSLGQQ